jgi:NAD(P)H dehydrogenase (quinone)
MHAHVVLAHPEIKSFNASLARLACRALADHNWGTSFSDLYTMGFDPCERAEHYRPRLDSERFDVQAEQRHASTQNSIPAMVKDELNRLDRADLLILQYPMWWHLPPAMLKGWIDRVFIYGDAYTSKMRFENGRFRGKRAMISVTVGTGPETYAHDGRSGDIDMLLWPVHFSLAYVGFRVLQPFIAYGVEAGLKYSDPDAVRKRLQGVEESFAERLAAIDDVPEIRFNRMSEWGTNGRIAQDAPAHSAFIRHRRELDLG